MAVSVTDGQEGIENATVTLTDADENEYTGRTGSAGGCNIQNVPVGTYSVAATCEGYEDYASLLDIEISEENKSISIEMDAPFIEDKPAT